MNILKLLGCGLLTSAMIGAPWISALAQVVQSVDEATEFPLATLACKVKMGTITETAMAAGTKADATCEVLSPLKGECGKNISITFHQNGNGPGQVTAGEVYVIMLDGKAPPFRMFARMKGVEDIVEPRFGTKPGDRLLAEMVALSKSTDAAARISAIEQIGIMRDSRGKEVVAAVAADRDEATARAAVIAEYRMKIAPNAKRVMELFNEQVMDVWYQESGTPQKDSNGESIWREEGNVKILERGLPEFDYATYVREGIKYEWVRKDDNTLYVFFGVPWKVQRKACVPELVKLLDDRDTKVRWWAVTCMVHTVEDKHEYLSLKQFKAREKQELQKWKTWWNEKGQAYMKEPAKRSTGG